MRILRAKIGESGRDEGQRSEVNLFTSISSLFGRRGASMMFLRAKPSDSKSKV